MKRKIDVEALWYVAEKIISSGHVINAQALAKLAKVDKGTISRNLRAIGIPLGERREHYEGSRDAELRSYQEIARLVQKELENEDLSKPGHLISGKELVKRLGLSCSGRTVRIAMQKYGVPNSWERRKKR